MAVNISKLDHLLYGSNTITHHLNEIRQIFLLFNMNFTTMPFKKRSMSRTEVKKKTKAVLSA